MKTLTCPECGVTFTTSARNQVCCTPECQAQRRQRLKKEANDRNNAKDKARRRKARLERQARIAESKRTSLCGKDLYDAFSASKPVCFAVLAKARTKPANTSEVRWRMELRRRAMQKRFGQKNLDLLPDPDLL